MNGKWESQRAREREWGPLRFVCGFWGKRARVIHQQQQQQKQHQRVVGFRGLSTRDDDEEEEFGTSTSAYIGRCECEYKMLTPWQLPRVVY
eukprot:scaffold4927_cov139-Amphora_coffeaeformis.AAC.5